MATTVLNNVTVLVGGTNLSGACNEATVNYAAEMLDETTFGQTTRKRKGGLTTFTLALKGFLVDGSTGAEPNLATIVGSSGTIFALFPSTVTSCKPCGYAGRGVLEAYEVGGAVGVITPFSATIQGQKEEV